MRRTLFILMVAMTTPMNVQSAPSQLTLALGGDVMFGRMKAGAYVAHPAGELQRWAATFRKADVAFVNLETGICEQGRRSSKLPLLWAPPERLDELLDAGVDVVSVANNHSLDCGPEGLTTTRRELARRKLAAVGSPSTGPWVTENLVVIAATMHPPPCRRGGDAPVGHSRGDEQLFRSVAELRREYPDRALMVSLHWGRERSTKVAAWQRALAARLVDAGATVVAGHGPHTPQRVEQLGDALVLYSLGNLVFDDTSPIGRPVAPRRVSLSRGEDGWRAELAEEVATD